MKVLSSGLPEVVGDNEDLARFLTSSSYFSSIAIKPAAFLPNPKDGETSVFRHGGEPVDALWRIGEEHVAGERTVHGAAIFKARSARAANLDVKAQEPPPRHANITAWPLLPDDPALQKARQKERAMLIAGNSTLVRRATDMESSVFF